MRSLGSTVARQPTEGNEKKTSFAPPAQSQRKAPPGKDYNPAPPHPPCYPVLPVPHPSLPPPLRNIRIPFQRGTRRAEPLPARTQVPTHSRRLADGPAGLRAGRGAADGPPRSRGAGRRGR